MNADLVSIVIVGYNNWPDLDLAIVSALQQSYRPVEVIVVDNASTDATSAEVPRRFGQTVRYHRQANRGDAGGYNTGMALASGDFVQFIDGDDFLAPDKIEKQMEIFRREPEVDIVYGDMRRFLGSPGQADWEDYDVQDYEDMIAAIVSPSARFAPHSFLYRRRALERVGPWDESLYIADTDYWLRAACAGCRFRYTPGALYFYRRRPGQMTADPVAMYRGSEAGWIKTLSYVSGEAYRSVIVANLARIRYRQALSDTTLSVGEALRKLAAARSTDGKAVPALALAGAAAVILWPGGRRLVTARWLRPIRHWLGRRTGFRQP